MFQRFPPRRAIASYVKRAKTSHIPLPKVHLAEMMLAITERIPNSILTEHHVRHLKLNRRPREQGRGNRHRRRTRWEKWHNPSKRRIQAITELEVRTCVALLAAGAMHSVVDHTYFRYGSQLYKQDSGLPTGGSLSGFLAEMRMADWYEELQAKEGPLLTSSLAMFKRYVDDCIARWRAPVQSLHQLVASANLIDPTIQLKLTIPTPDQPKLVMLDTQQWIAPSSDGTAATWQYEFYRKPESGNRTLPADSNTPMMVKQSFASNEFLRIRQRCSKQEFATPHVALLKNRLLKGGYPLWWINKQNNNAIARYQGIVWQAATGERNINRSRLERHAQRGDTTKFGPPGERTLWLPRISDRVSTNVREAVRTSGLPCQVRELSGPPLKLLLHKFDRDPPTCDNAVVREVFGEEQSGRACWLSSDLVYRVRCMHCLPAKHYVGETSQQLFRRMYQHNYNLVAETEDRSALAEHVADAHPGMPMKLELVDVIPTRGFVDRKCTESIWTHCVECSINRRTEGNGTIGNLYWQ
jgi:hypothetical protein